MPVRLHHRRATPRRALVLVAAVLALSGCGRGERYTEIIDVEPAVDAALVTAPPADSKARNEAMLGTFRTFGDLHVMTYVGDFDQAIAFQHHQGSI